MARKQNEFTIKIETPQPGKGVLKDEDDKKGQEQQVQQQPAQAPLSQPQQPAVIPDPLGTIEQVQAAGRQPAYVPPGGVDVMNPRPTPVGTFPADRVSATQPLRSAATPGSVEAAPPAQETAPPEEDAYQVGYDALQTLLSEQAQKAAAAAGDTAEELEKARLENERKMRSEHSRKVIAGLGDAISAVVNLIGVSGKSSNIPLSGVAAMQKVVQAIEAERAKRAQDIEKLRSNLSSQLTQMNNYNLKLAEQGYKSAKDAADRADKRAKDAWERQFKEKDAATKADQWQKTFDANQQKTAAQLAETERHNRAGEAISRSREDRLSRGSGSGSAQNAYAHYSEMLDELAKRNGRPGVNNWNDLLDDINSQSGRSLAAKISAAGITGEYANIIKDILTGDKNATYYVQKYGNKAPDFYNKYIGGTIYEGAAEDPEDIDIDTVFDIMDDEEDDIDKNFNK